MFDYPTLRVIWWALMGVLLAGFAILDGFDLGAAALLPFIGRTDNERRIIINTVGPVWEGNQVWFIVAGGSFFAAWPYLYAAAFSGFYLAMFLVLATFIVRPVGFKYRSKLNNTTWRGTWDWLLASAAIIAALTFGIAIGNVLQGVPFYFNNDLRMFYTGSFFSLFNPFALLCGIVSIVMITMQGAAYLTTKTENPIQQRSIHYVRVAAILLIVLYAFAGLWMSHSIQGYVLSGPINPAGPSNPLHKVVIQQTGAWIANYFNHPRLMIAPLCAFLGAVGALLFIGRGRSRLAFLSSSLCILGMIGSVGFSMFPFILPSSSTFDASLTVWDASASHLSLAIMLIVAIIFLPIILLYTSWVYRVMRGKVTQHSIEDNHHSY